MKWQFYFALCSWHFSSSLVRWHRFSCYINNWKTKINDAIEEQCGVQGAFTQHNPRWINNNSWICDLVIRMIPNPNMRSVRSLRIKFKIFTSSKWPIPNLYIIRASIFIHKCIIGHCQTASTARQADTHNDNAHVTNQLHTIRKQWNYNYLLSFT